MRIVRTVALAVMCLIAHASVAADRGFYFGLNAGQAKYDFAYQVPQYPLSVPIGPVPPGSFYPFPTGGWSGPIATIPAPIFRDVPAFPVSGFVSAALPVQAFWIPRNDDEANAWGGLVGYRILPYAAAELSFTHLGTLHEYQPQFTGTNFILPAVESDMETSGPALSVLAILPLNAQWDLYLRGGVLFADQKVSHASSFASGSQTYGSTDLLFGAGAQVNLGEHWTVRLDFQHYDDVGEDDWIGEADVSVWSLGVLFRL